MLPVSEGELCAIVCFPFYVVVRWPRFASLPGSVISSLKFIVEHNCSYFGTDNVYTCVNKEILLSFMKDGLLQ